MPEGAVPPAGGMRERIMRGALQCVERDGVGAFSLEDVAAEAGTSRTTIYRHFPGGRAQLLAETAVWEVGRFWSRLAAEVEELDTLEDRLVTGLVLGSSRIRDSRIVANLMDPDLDELADAFGTSEPIVFAVVRDYMATLLEEEREAGRLRDGVDVADAADYLTRMIMSVMAAPAGTALDAPDAARSVVRRQFLAGIVETPQM